MLGDEYYDLTSNPHFPDGFSLESILINADTISSQLRRNDRFIPEREKISTLQEEIDNIKNSNNILLPQ